jgi:IMP dehydrogenase/GMP reductase
MKIIYDTALTYDDVTLVPQKSWIKTRKDISIRTKVSKNYYIDVPIIASPMDTVVGEKMIYVMGKLGGLAIMHRFVSIDEQIRILKSVQEKWAWESIRPIVGASVGVKDIDYENAIRLLEEAHVNIILIDIAHGHCEMMREMLSKLVKLKEKYKFDIIAGNVATAEATEDLIRWGADGIRVGIGGGCFTPDMKVNTKNGLKEIQHIEIGDYVYTHKSRLKRVIGKIMYNTSEEMLLINEKIKCTKNHELYVLNIKYKNIVNDENIHDFAEWIDADKINSDYFLIEMVDVGCV